ncbi:MAG: hypothetical protein KY461_07755 [Actinobacteria bacterium]|nr:hypothetical protein [Actinomycetota bacterium]
MAIISTLTRTAASAAEIPLRGLQTMLDPDGAGDTEKLSALDRRLRSLEDQLKELSELDQRVSTLVRAEVDRAVAPLAKELGATRKDVAEIRKRCNGLDELRDSVAKVREDVDHIRTRQAADKADSA